MSLEQGKAAEHLVCYDLIMQGYKAYLSDQGLPYDVVLDKGGKLFRVQVKSTLKPTLAVKKGVTHRTDRQMYRFNTRCGKGGKSQITKDACDIIAFVALSVKEIAYIKIEDEPIPQCVEFAVGRKTTTKKAITEYPIGDLF